MAIRIQFAGDKSIGVGSRPPGAFSLFKPPGAAFPPAGSYNSTLFGVEYPTAEGGTSFADPTNGANPPIPNQICDVDVLNDGSGGTYTDWSSVTNVQYKAPGTLFATETGLDYMVELPPSSGFYYKGGTYDTELVHDGSGGYSANNLNYSFYPANTDTNIEGVSNGDHQTEVPAGSGNYYSNGLFNGYNWDGSGGYNSVTKGAYYSNGTDTNLTGLDSPSYTDVPTGSGNNYANGRVYGYTWDGSGGYNFPVTKVAYYSNGTDTNLVHLDSPQQTEVPSGSTNYYNNGLFDGYTWDGNGGYNYPVTKGAYHANGTFIIAIATGQVGSNYVEVPSGSGNTFADQQEVLPYNWDGGGGYTTGSTYYAYYQSGNYITTYGGTDYYWNGSGGFYP